MINDRPTFDGLKLQVGQSDVLEAVEDAFQACEATQQLVYDTEIKDVMIFHSEDEREKAVKSFRSQANKHKEISLWLYAHADKLSNMEVLPKA